MLIRTRMSGSTRRTLLGVTSSELRSSEGIAEKRRSGRQVPSRGGAMRSTALSVKFQKIAIAPLAGGRLEACITLKHDWTLLFQPIAALHSSRAVLRRASD